MSCKSCKSAFNEATGEHGPNCMHAYATRHRGSAAGLVRLVTVERFVDMAGAEHSTHAAAWKASIHGLLASRLADEGIPAPDAIAAAILEVFVMVPRREAD